MNSGEREREMFSARSTLNPCNIEKFKASLVRMNDLMKRGWNEEDKALVRARVARNEAGITTERLITELDDQRNEIYNDESSFDVRLAEVLAILEEKPELLTPVVADRVKRNQSY